MWGLTRNRQQTLDGIEKAETFRKWAEYEALKCMQQPTSLAKKSHSLKEREMVEPMLMAATAPPDPAAALRANVHLSTARLQLGLVIDNAPP